MEKITLIVTKELKERLSKEATMEGRSISNHIKVNYLENEVTKIEPATHEAVATGGAEVDKVVSLLPQQVIDFYQEEALGSDGDLYKCLARNLIERAKVNGIHSDDTTNVKITEVQPDYRNIIGEANRKIRSMKSLIGNEISSEEVNQVKKSLGVI
jgi:hypothetical protein